MIADIFDALRMLVASPHSDPRRAALTFRPLRFKLVRDYLIAYVTDESPVWVVAVLHGSRNPCVMAAILRGREEETR